MLKLILVGVGGFLGAVSRYYVTGIVHRWFDSRFPYGTLAVNIVGCFLLGLIMYFVQNSELIRPNTRLFISMGFIGALTTYSAFAYETFEMLADQRLVAAALNISVQLAAGIGAVWLAMVVAREISK